MAIAAASAWGNKPADGQGVSRKGQGPQFGVGHPVLQIVVVKRCRLTASEPIHVLKLYDNCRIAIVQTPAAWVDNSRLLDGKKEYPFSAHALGAVFGLTAAVKQIDAMIGEDFWALGRRETEAISGYAEVEQQCQRQKRPSRVNQVA